MNISSPVIAFDFDGVVARYVGFVHHHHIEEPNAEVVKAMKLLRGQGCKILIHSTRGDEFLKKYYEKFSIPFDYINRRPDKEGENPGKPIASVYVDDHTICYRGEDAKTLISKIAHFKPYWME